MGREFCCLCNASHLHCRPGGECRVCSPGRLIHIHTTDKPNCYFSEETEVTYSAPEKRKGKPVQHLSCPSLKICAEGGQAAGEHRRMGDQWSCTPPSKGSGAANIICIYCIFVALSSSLRHLGPPMVIKMNNC